MRTDSYFDSHGRGKIHAICWSVEGRPKAIVQIVHGIAEYAERYDAFARYLNDRGILVTAEDHMGHGLSINNGGIQGYFHGGWFTAIEDTMELMRSTMAAYPGIPYVLFGHSMGSFMARTILCKYPDSGISAAVICGTSWQPRAALPALIGLCQAICAAVGEENTNDTLQGMVFGGYNKKVEHPRTESDWLTRDYAVVDAYEADPLCGFTPTTGLIRDMLTGIHYMEQSDHLAAMQKQLPVFLIGGEDDPVGFYGKSVPKTAKEFRRAGMQNVTEKLYPLCRHEILNEINREEVYRDVSEWIFRNVTK